MEKARMGRSTLWVWVVSVAISGIALAFVLSRLDLSDLGRVLRAADIGFLVLALAAVLTETAFAAYRLRLLLPRRRTIGFYECLRITGMHGVYLVLLPARIGELAYLVLLNRVARQSPGAAVGNLIYQRLSDAVVIVFLFMCTVLLAFTDQARSPWLWLGIAAGATAVTVCWINIHRLMTALSRIGLRVLGRRLQAARFVVRLLLQARHWSRQITHIEVRLATIALTLAAWIAAAVTVVCLFRSFHADLSFEHMVLAGIAVQVISAIPVYTIGGLGITEAGLAGVLVAFDVEMARAVTLALVVRLGLVFGQIAVLALIALIAPVGSLNRQTEARSS